MSDMASHPANDPGTESTAPTSPTSENETMNEYVQRTEQSAPQDATSIEEPRFAPSSDSPQGSDPSTWFDQEATEQATAPAPAQGPEWTPSYPTARPAPSGPVSTAPVPVITGPAPVPIILGILGLVIAVTAVVTRAADLIIDWGRAGPVTVLGAGLLLVVFGLIGMRGRSRTGEPS